jgi:hypothetical protein
MTLTPAEIAAAKAANARWQRSERRRTWLLAAGYVLVALLIGGAFLVGHLNNTTTNPPPVTSASGAAITTDPDLRLPYRIGAVCADGWDSHATGRGACSWHGGVREWLVSDCNQVDIALARAQGRRLPDCTFRLDKAT